MPLPPSWRGRRRNPVTGKAEWQQPVTKDRNEVLAWLGPEEKPVSTSGSRRPPVVRSRASATSGSLVSRPGGSAVGKAAPSRTPPAPSPTTRGPIATSSVRSSGRCRRTTSRRSNGRCGATGSAAKALPVPHLDLVAVASAIYAWAMRRPPLATRNRSGSSSCPRTTRSRACASRSLPKRSGCSPRSSPRTNALRDRVLRRPPPAEIHRLEWPDVLDGDRIGSRLLVTALEERGGHGATPPIAEPLRESSARLAPARAPDEGQRHRDDP